MNTKEIETFIRLLEESNLESLTYKKGDFEISLKKPEIGTVQASPVIQTVPNQTTENFGKTIDAPLVGVFYTKPGPDAEAFVNIGHKISKGDVICIIEAMKVMNEIKADQSGTVEEILIKDGETVDYGQPLFKIS